MGRFLTLDKAGLPTNAAFVRTKGHSRPFPTPTVGFTYPTILLNLTRP